MKVRINKYISESSSVSRRQADKLILEGKVELNNRNITTPGIIIDPEKDQVKVNNVQLTGPIKKVYYALNKPKGVVSTVKDELGRKKVTDFVPKSPPVYPIGRLDANSEGLIILTNDGDLTNKLTHPSFEHSKEYKVLCKIKNNKIGSNLIVQKFKRGLKIDNVLMKADDLDIIENKDNELFLFRIILHTGYNRQIRKMCDKIGLKVVHLTRTKIAKLSLSDLKIETGEYKKIKKSNIL